MQGKPVHDVMGNLARIVDIVPGPSLYDYLRRLEMSHERYYHTRLNQLMQSTTQAIAAIVELHKLGLNHGDIRADHIILRNQTDKSVWIDFDYDVEIRLYDTFCLGNVLSQAVGKGRHSLYDIRYRPSDYPDSSGSLDALDMSLMFQRRIANLRKLFPYITSETNSVLMRFAFRASDPCPNAEALLSDLISLSFPAITINKLIETE